MATGQSPRRPRRSGARRDDALSRERIVAVATEVLDADGERGLTFRALAARLATGPGAIYWHVTDKDALMAACTDAVIAHAVAEVAEQDADPRSALRSVAVAVYDAVDAHPWVGTELARRPGSGAMLPVTELVGERLGDLGLAGRERFHAATTLQAYLLGLAAQHAAAARLAPAHLDRERFLASVAQRWDALDEKTYPSVREMATWLPGHDDREQFLAGVDYFLAGILTRPDDA